MGRDHESLAGSKETRQELLQRFEGKIPESIMVYNRSDRAIDFVADKRANEVKKNLQIESDSLLEEGSKEFDFIVDQEEYTRSIKSGFGGSRGTKDDSKALSRFFQNIARNVIKFYTEEGDIIVDPFAGHNSRFEAAFRTKRHYYGQDLCHEFMVDNFKIRDILLKQREDLLFVKEEQTIIELTEGDSRHLPWPDNFGNFTITSPPYWDIEFYGTEAEQLGTGKSYREFLQGMYEVAKENYRVLKPGSFCVWAINDFIKNGNMYSYHIDTLNILMKAGFINWDIIIVDLGSSLRSIFFGASFKAKRIPKRHEYMVVVRKPF